MRPNVCRLRWPLIALLPALLATPASPQQRSGRPITETDLYRFTWIADPQISPDGTRIVYVQVTVNPKRDGYETSLWLVPAGANETPRRLTAGPRDGSPAWSPDGRALAFLRAVERDGKVQPPQIYLLRMEGGEASRVTDLSKGAGSPVWSPDGKTLAFAASTPIAPKQSAGDSAETDVRVITRAAYREDNQGYAEPGVRSHLWTVAVPAAAGAPVAPRQLTSGEFDETAPAWARDGSRIYFTSTRLAEPEYASPDADLYSVPPAGGEPTQVASIDGAIGDFAASPDGKRIAFVGILNAVPPHSYNQPDLFVVDLASGATPRNLTAAYDYDIGDGIAADQHAPRGRLPAGPVWTADGSAILIRSARQGRANLERFEVATGRASPVTAGDQEIVAYTATPDGSRFALVASTQTMVGDLFLAAPGSGGPATLTPMVRPNASLFGELALEPAEEIWYKSFDGTRIHGWIQKPPGFEPARKYPAILQIHGGPHAAYGHSLYHEIQWMAAKGYVVLYVNPRGSSSYGQQLGNVIQYRYPGDDFKDLMVGVDTLLGRGYVDPKRLGVTGGSGGGLLTNWTVTQTNRFAAAVAQRDIADWGSFWYTADFSQFTPFWFRKTPWQDPREFAERSPITYVDRVTTPLMLVVGEADYRTPAGAGGEIMFRALKFLKKQVVMVRFPGESHELSRSGQPRHRVERLRHIVNWFDLHLMGKPIEGYRVQ